MAAAFQYTSLSCLSTACGPALCHQVLVAGQQTRWLLHFRSLTGPRARRGLFHLFRVRPFTRQSDPLVRIEIHLVIAGWLPKGFKPSLRLLALEGATSKKKRKSPTLPWSSQKIQNIRKNWGCSVCGGWWWLWMSTPSWVSSPLWMSAFAWLTISH